jgi:hypothetical protein
MSDVQSIPQDVSDFIQRHIDSVAQLEALLLLRRSPDERWDAGKMARRIYTNEADAAQLLTRLAADGFLGLQNDLYYYDCKSPSVHATIDRLIETYARLLIPITNLIHSKPRRIREFADAFRLRKDP